MPKPRPNPLDMGELKLLDFSQMPLPPIDFESIVDIMKNVLIEEDFVFIPAFLKTIDSNKRPEVAIALTEIAIENGLIKQLIDWITTVAIEEVGDPNLTLRENSLASVIMSKLMDHIGYTKLIDLLKKDLQELANISEKMDICRTCELDAPSSFKFKLEADRVIGNSARLEKIVKNLCAKITNDDSFKMLSPLIGYLLSTLYQKANDKHGRNIAWIAITNIFCLRFVQPAIADVKKWKTCLKIRKNNLTLYTNCGIITKILNRISLVGNFDEEDDFSIFNTIVENSRPKLKDFLTRLTDKSLKKAWKELKLVPVSKKKLNKDLGLILDYITKSRKKAFDAWEQNLIRITVRKQNEKTALNLATIGGNYLLLKAVFFKKQELRTHLISRYSAFEKRKRVRIGRVYKKTSSSKELKQLSSSIVPVKKDNYQGDEAFIYDVNKTLESFVKEKLFTVLVFYRGEWCAFCREYMQEWNNYSDKIFKAGGVLIGVSSQEMDFVKETSERWQLNYQLLGDPEAVLAKEFSVEISHSGGGPDTNYSSMGNAKYSFGMIQPAVIAFNPKDRVPFFSWKSVPQKSNIHGATDRIDTTSCTNLILNNRVVNNGFDDSTEESYDISLETSASETDDEKDGVGLGFGTTSWDIEYDDTFIKVGQVLNNFPEKKAKLIKAVLDDEKDNNQVSELLNLLKNDKRYTTLFCSSSMKRLINSEKKRNSETVIVVESPTRKKKSDKKRKKRSSYKT